MPRIDYKSKEAALIHKIVDEFGGDKKPILMDYVKSLLRNQRVRFIKQIEINLDKLE